MMGLVSGQEGRQAVMASDFSMGQFRFLVPLLLVHGHWNYQRMSYMILDNFYRNAIFVFMLFWNVFYSCYSLENPIVETSGLLYSAVYTALPTIVVGVCDQDLSRKNLLRRPQLYGAGLRDESYSFKLIMLDSVWQSLVLFYVPFFLYRNTNFDVASFGDILILGVVMLVNAHLAMDVKRWNYIMFGIICGCTIVTVCCVFALDSSPTTVNYKVINHLVSTELFWVCILSIIVSAFLPRFTVKAFKAYLQPDDIQIAREYEKFRKLNEAEALESFTGHLARDRQESAE